MKIIFYAMIVMAAVSCRKEVVRATLDEEPEEKTYLALGDSYTSGEGLLLTESFPYQLAAKLRTAGINMAPPRIIATTGWMTYDLIHALQTETLADKYDVVTILVGVNNQYAKRSLIEYRQHFAEILNIAISRSRGERSTVYVLSIPDWSVTPFGRLKDSKLESSSIAEYNAVNIEESKKANVNFIDITASSLIAGTDPSYTSDDGLNPSAKMYAEWAAKLLPLVQKDLD